MIHPMKERGCVCQPWIAGHVPTPLSVFDAALHWLALHRFARHGKGNSHYDNALLPVAIASSFGTERHMLARGGLSAALNTDSGVEAYPTIQKLTNLCVKASKNSGFETPKIEVWRHLGGVPVRLGASWKRFGLSWGV